MLKRTVYLLSLLKENEPVTGKNIAERLGVSERTIRYDMEELREYGRNNGFDIISRAHYGYTLVVTEPKRFKAFKKDNRPDSVPVEPDDRLGYFIVSLLLSSFGLSTRQTEDDLIVSNSTVKRLITEASEVLKHYRLRITHSRGFHRAVGTESNIRLCIADSMIHYRVFRYFRNYDQSRFRSIQHQVDTLIQKHGIGLPEVSYNHFLIYLFVDISRISSNHLLEDGKSDDPGDCAEKYFIEELNEFLVKNMGISMNQTEKNLLTYRTIGLHMNYERSLINADPDIEAVIDEAFAEIQKQYNINLSENKELRYSLTAHLSPLIYRLRYHTLLMNPLKTEIKERFSFAWEMSGIICAVLSGRYHRIVHDDEKGYLAVIIESGLEKLTIHEKKKTLLVCDCAVCLAQKLKDQIQERLSQYLSSIVLCDNLSVHSINADAYDLVLTTIDLSIRHPDMIRIHTLPTEADWQKLRVKLESSSQAR